jgi:hypothetical protein
LIDGMRINTYAATRKEAVNRIFNWVNIKLDQFQAKNLSPESMMSPKEEALRTQIMKEFRELVNLDAQQTFLLIDEKFNHEHEKFLASLMVQKGASEAQFKYLDTMLAENHAKIQACIEEFVMQNTNK